MLKFICNTCGTEYETEITSNRIVYISGSKRVSLTDENADCVDCEEAIKEDIEIARQHAREKVKAKKHGTAN